jgi:flagellar hook protein FlgE
MSFQQGLSGLSASTKQLEVIGNNVANSSTVGFKGSKTQFGDVYAAQLNGATAGAAGIGVQVVDIKQSFTQGTVTASANPLDMAVNGDGFFRVSNNGAITYTRDGQFSLSKDGFVVTSTGEKLTGYTVDQNGVLSTGSQSELKINSADIKPNQTSSVDAVMNLDSRSPILVSANFDPANPATYTSSSSVNVFDSLGNSHILQTYYVKSGAGTWDVYGTSDGAKIGSAPLGSLTFRPDGTVDKTATTLPFTAAISGSGGASTPFNVAVDFENTTQFGSNFGVTTLDQDGYASGRLSGFTVGDDGIITGRYSNGKTSTLGQVVLASFKNPNGLQPLGNNQWAETAESGQGLVGAPNTGNLGALQASAVEESNVDLTAALVDMITAQRAYQANAQTIKTQDQVLQTLVNLR